jgi:hypothetical protein
LKFTVVTAVVGDTIRDENSFIVVVYGSQAKWKQASSEASIAEETLRLVQEVVGQSATPETVTRSGHTWLLGPREYEKLAVPEPK